MRRVLKFIFPLLLLSPVLSGCSSEEFRGFGFSEGVTSVNESSFSLWQGAWLAAAVVGVFTMVLILWPAIFHRKKDESIPRQFQYNIPVEIAYTVIPFLIIAVLFGYTAKAQTEIKSVSPVSATDVHDVTVNAIQWSRNNSHRYTGTATNSIYAAR
jgi:cytochrome c oxidase subunit 2